MTEGLESLGRVRLQGILLLVVAFGVGALAGAAGERIRAASTPPTGGPEARRPGRPGELRFLDPLGLTDDQRREIGTIFASSRAVTDSILNESLPALRAVTDSIQRQIRAVLTPEQQERFDRMDAMWRGGPGRFGPGMRPPRRPGGGPPPP